MTDKKYLADEDLLQIIKQAAEDGREELVISNERLMRLPVEIAGLTNLKRLTIEGGKLTSLPVEIGRLVNLIELSVWDNDLTDIPQDIRNLSKLKYLDMSQNKLLEFPRSILSLKNLKTLSMSDNMLNALPNDIRMLHRLEKLELQSNKLKYLPQEIGDLTHLIELDLTANELVTLPENIHFLKNLREIYLGGNNLEYLPIEFFSLENLEKIVIWGNQLMNLPTKLFQMINVTSLNLADRKITTFPPQIMMLRRLTELSLHNNQLREVPEDIGQLNDLTRIDLANNHLIILPQSIGKLNKLKYLNLRNNRLTTLPLELGQLIKLEELDLEGNRLSSPPPEIVGQGSRAILTYLRERLEGASQQWASKLIIVGEGGVGKTSLLRTLRGEMFLPQLDSTHGIMIGSLPLSHPTEPDITMMLNSWDFGGQEIYHATHQFFLTNRSLFLLAWNARHGFEQGKLYYGLDTIQALAPDSPILLVATWTDERDPDLPLTELRQKYPQIAGQIAISNKTGAGIEQLRQKIANAAAKLPLMGETWPTTWLDAANTIRGRTEKHITSFQLNELMAKHGVKETSVDVLARWLHELGDILYFPDSEELSETVILKPQWVTEYISKVLTSEEVIERRGVFSRKQMHALWAELDAGMREHFLRLMERFDLSYRTLEDRDISLIVERLPFEPADYAPSWDEIATGDECNAITMRFRLSTVPAGIPTWFIARSHRFTTGKHWRAGALFEDNHADGKHLALVRAFPQERFVELAVRGPAPQNFFALLRDGVEVTLKRFPGLEIKRMIPCPCPGENGNGCTHEFDYALLVKRLNKKPEVECPVSLKELSVVDLLFGIDWSTRDAVLSAIHDLKSAGAAQHQQVVDKIDNLTELAQREFTSIFNREQRLVESHCPNVFVLRPRDTSGWRKWLTRVKNPLTAGFYDLQLYCQQPGTWHRAPDGGLYEIDEPREWFTKVAPILREVAKLLPLALPTIGWAAPLLGAGASKAVQDFEIEYKIDIEFTKAIAEQLKDLKLDESVELAARDNPHQIEGASLRALRVLLDAKDPQHHWGSLKKVLTPEGHYLWLCEHHAAQYKM